MCHVRVLGHSLKPAFDIEMGSSGLISLKYYPEAIEDVLQRIAKLDEESDKENLFDNDEFENPPPNDALWARQIEDLWQMILLVDQA